MSGIQALGRTSAAGTAHDGNSLREELRVSSRYCTIKVLYDWLQTATLIADDTETSRRVVVKVILQDALTRSVRTRLEYEAAIRRQLPAEVVTPVLDFGSTDQAFYVVMPWIEGRPLADRLQQGPLSVHETLVVAKQLFKSLDVLHRGGVLHRDIKPANVIINDGPSLEWAKLVDFGTVRSFRPDRLVGERERSAVRYMSPEQAGSIDCDVGESSDLYSAGVLLFHCLAGRPPFEGLNAGAILFEHLTARVPELPTINREVPRALDDVVQRLLRKDPHDRYQFAGAVVADLEAIELSWQAGDRDPSVVIGSTDHRCTLTEPAFVGRVNELSQLDALTEQTRRGRGGTMLLEGESGSGKSRLLVEVAKQARRDGLWVLHGQGTTQVGQSPFRLLAGIVDGFLTAADADPGLAALVREKLIAHADTLCAAFPSLRKVFPASQQHPLSPAAFGEARTIQSLTAFLDALGDRDRPVIIILDDCQWADELTYRLIQRWQTVARQAGKFTSIIVAFRAEEVAADHALRRIDRSVHVALAPFQPPEIQRLVESMAGTLPQEAIDVIARLSDGSPFMASAVLRGLVETRALVADRDGWRIESRAVKDLQSSRQAASFLARRIDLLPAATIQLLSVGAVVGKEFGLDIAASLAELAPSDAVAALAQARERRLVWARPDGGSFAFVHDQIRATLLQRLSTSEQQWLHRLAAYYLQSFAPDRYSDIAYHFDAAGDSASALEYALKAAEQARSRFSLEIAEAQYQIAKRGADQAESSIQFRIAEGLGDTLMLRGHYAAAAPLFEQAARLAQGQLARASIQGRLAELSFKRGDMEAATSGFEAALRMLGRHIPRSSAMFVLLLAWEAVIQLLHTFLPAWFVHRYHRPPTESERLSLRLFSLLTHGCWYCRSKIQCLWAHLRGLNLAERFPPTLELAHAYSEHAPVMCLVPLFGRAIRYAQRSLEMRKSFHDVWGQGQSLNFYSVVLYAASRYRECVEAGREAVRLLERTGDYWQVHIARYQVAAALYRLGDFEAAIAESKLNHESGLELGDEQASGIILDVWARAAQGQLPEEVIAVELARKRHDAQGSTQVLLAEGIRQLHENRLESAVETFQSAVNVAAKAGIHNAYTLPSLAWLATACRRQLEETSIYAPARRRRLVRRAQRAVGKALRAGKVCRNDYPRACREAALLAAMSGRLRRARQMFDRALAAAEQQEAAYEHAKTLWYRGRVGQEVGWETSERDIAQAERALNSIAGKLGRSRSNLGDGASQASVSLADRFDTVLETGRRIASALSPTKIYEEAQSAALRLLRGEQCLLLEVRRNDQEYDVRIALGPQRASYSEVMLERVIHTGRALAFVEEVADAEAGGPAAGHERSALCVPIHVRGRIAACLYVTNDQVRGLFGVDEERLADFVATIAGAALENAEGFRSLESLNATLEQRVAERTAAAEARAAELAQSNLELERIARELRSTEEQLRDAMAAAEAANVAKSRFLATMSHEIRTPMNGILGMTEVALRTPLSAQQRNYLSVVRQSGDALLNLLNDILDLSKIEAGKMELEEIAFEPRAVIRASIGLMGVSAAQKRVELICRIAPDVPQSLLGDPSRLRQVIDNLLGNAIKFTDEGEVFLDMSVERSADSQAALLRVSVQDTGVGIPADKQKVIFESFCQSDSSTTRRFGGTGLGLAISAQLVELMQGRIWVESEPGCGSTFHFVIPLRCPADEAVNEPPAAELAGFDVLLCCERITARQVYRELLENAGAKVTCLVANQEPWEEVTRWHASTRGCRQLLLIDADARHARGNRLFTPDCRERLEQVNHLVLTPASAGVGPDGGLPVASERCLTKPTACRELIETILAGSTDGSDLSSNNSCAELKGTRSLQVLLAEDGIVNQEVAVALLELMGHRCEVANNGKEALEAFERSTFDVIFMDLEMPGMDGFDVTKRIRDRERLRGTHTPIVAMTAHALVGFRERCLQAGMDDYLPKPIQPESLHRLCQSLAK